MLLLILEKTENIWYHVAAELGSENKSQILIPRGFAIPVLWCYKKLLLAIKLTTIILSLKRDTSTIKLGID